ncbi:MAG: TVP38/TMEM64 family protein [Parvularculales bacterium]
MVAKSKDIYPPTKSGQKTLNAAKLEVNIVSAIFRKMKNTKETYMTDQQTPQNTSRRRSTIKRLAPLVVIIIAMTIVFQQGWHHYLTFENIAANRNALFDFVNTNYILALAVYMGIYIVTVALSLPGGALMTITGGFLFGWQVGGSVTVIAATLGATVIFLVARTSLGEPMAARAGPWLGKLRDGFQKDALNYLLFLRLVPAFPFWLVNLAPALLGVPLRTYVIGTSFGIIPGTFAFSFLGPGLDSIIATEQEKFNACLATQQESAVGAIPGEVMDEIVCDLTLSPGSLITMELLIAFAALGIVALIPVIIKRIQARRAT